MLVGRLPSFLVRQWLTQAGKRLLMYFTAPGLFWRSLSSWCYKRGESPGPGNRFQLKGMMCLLQRRTAALCSPSEALGVRKSTSFWRKPNMDYCLIELCLGSLIGLERDILDWFMLDCMYYADN